MGKKSIVSIVHRDEIPGLPWDYQESDVETIYEMIAEATDLLGGVDSLLPKNGDVVIKVNSVFSDFTPGVTTTDPRLVEALILLLKKRINPKKIRVAENATAVWLHPGLSSVDAMESSGIAKAARKHGAEVIALETDAHVEVRIPKAKVFTSFMCPQTILKADSIIYMPKMKTHVPAVVTLGMKNAQGILSVSDKFRCHRDDIHQKMVDLLRAVKPDLVVIDGLWGLQGQSPYVYSTDDIIPDLNLVITSQDVVAADAVAAAIMGFDPLKEISTIQIAHNEGLGIGDLARIEVRGKTIEQVRRPFKRPTVNIVGQLPNANVYMGGACVGGCIGRVQHIFDRYGNPPIPVNFILGHGTIVPEDLHGPTFIIGDCAKEHKDRGIFYPGCPPGWSPGWERGGFWAKFDPDVAKLVPGWKPKLLTSLPPGFPPSKKPQK